MKKLLSFVLTLTLMMSSCVIANAQESYENVEGSSVGSVDAVTEINQTILRESVLFGDELAVKETVADIPAGIIKDSSVNIVVNVPEGYLAFYSTDGKMPTYKNGIPGKNTTLYDGPITLKADDTKSDYVTLKVMILNKKSGLLSFAFSNKYVFDVPVESFVINGNDSIAQGKSATYKAVYESKKIKNQKVEWSIAPATAEVKVNAKGKITVSNTATAQTYTLTAKCINNKGVEIVAEKSVEVKDINVTKVSVSNKSMTAYTSDKIVDLGKYVNCEVKNTALKPLLGWSSSDDSIATVDNAGLVSLKKAGTVKITVVATDGSNKKATVKLVIKEKVTDLDIAGSNVAAKGKTVSLKAIANPTNATNKKVKWSIASTDGEGVSISSSGKLKVSKNATATTCTVKAVSMDNEAVESTKVIKVANSVAKKVTSSLKSATLYRDVEGAEVAYKEVAVDFVITGTEGIFETKAFEIVSNNGNLITEDISKRSITPIDNTQYKVTAVFKTGSLGTGSTKIVFTTTDGSNKKVNITFKVVNPPSMFYIEGYEGKQIVLNKNEQTVLKAVVENAYGKAITSVKWSTSDKKVATVSSTGLVKATGVGETTITCTLKDGSGLCIEIPVLVIGENEEKPVSTPEEGTNDGSDKTGTNDGFENNGTGDGADNGENSDKENGTSDGIDEETDSEGSGEEDKESNEGSDDIPNKGTNDGSDETPEKGAGETTGDSDLDADNGKESGSENDGNGDREETNYEVYITEEGSANIITEKTIDNGENFVINVVEELNNVIGIPNKVTFTKEGNADVTITSGAESGKYVITAGNTEGECTITCEATSDEGYTASVSFKVLVVLKPINTDERKTIDSITMTVNNEAVKKVSGKYNITAVVGEPLDVSIKMWDADGSEITGRAFSVERIWKDEVTIADCAASASYSRNGVMNITGNKEGSSSFKFKAANPASDYEEEFVVNVLDKTITSITSTYTGQTIELEDEDTNANSGLVSQRIITFEVASTYPNIDEIVELVCVGDCFNTSTSSSYSNGIHTVCVSLRPVNGVYGNGSITLRGKAQTDLSCTVNISKPEPVVVETSITSIDTLSGQDSVEVTPTGGQYLVPFVVRTNVKADLTDVKNMLQARAVGTNISVKRINITEQGDCNYLVNVVVSYTLSTDSTVTLENTDGSVSKTVTCVTK